MKRLIKGMVNYSKSNIYKLCCKDPEITDVYVGSTTNFNRRKSEHKSRCYNENGKAYNYHVYQVIRENGGWENWDMVEIECYCATDKQDLHKRERYHLEELGATLNKNIPSRSVDEWLKDNVDYHTQYRKDNFEKLKIRGVLYRKDNIEKINKRATLYRKDNIEKLKKSFGEKIICSCGCTISKHNTKRHIKTDKHINLLKVNLPPH